jgi:predicted nucleic acid-binding protein
MSAEVVYLDSSALAKLVVHEAESSALRRYLRRRKRRATCGLARVEVVRAVRAHGAAAVAAARRILGGVDLIRLDDVLLDEASELGGGTLRTLDAIHLAAARSLRSDLVAVVTYDARMTSAATDLRLTVVAPR